MFMHLFFEKKGGGSPLRQMLKSLQEELRMKLFNGDKLNKADQDPIMKCCNMCKYIATYHPERLEFVNKPEFNSIQESIKTIRVVKGGH